MEASYPLLRSAAARWTLNLGLDAKHQRNLDDNVSLGVLETSGRTRSRAFSASLSGQQLDRLGWSPSTSGGQTQASVQLSSGRLSLAGSPDLLLQNDSQGAATAGGYQRLRWSLSRVQVLGPTLSLLASASGQVASSNLDAADKFYLGGLGAVNAYPSGEAGGSAGRLLNLELRQQLSPQWQVAGFVDWGHVRKYQSNSRADGNGAIEPMNGVTLKGLDASATWRANNGAQLKAVWARRMGSNPLATPNGSDTDGSLRKHRLWLSAAFAF